MAVIDGDLQNLMDTIAGSYGCLYTATVNGMDANDLENLAYQFMDILQQWQRGNYTTSVADVAQQITNLMNSHRNPE